ncbi:MAG: FHA domain-containing protein [Gammaproteobacteria bacterium]|nr:MAG: FHA domain-containing protein [Gammaproteobacteria bacterium]
MAEDEAEKDQNMNTESRNFVERRRGERRSYRTRPRFPLVDSDGNLVTHNRRRIVDRRLARLTPEEIQAKRSAHGIELRFRGKRYEVNITRPRLTLGRTHLCGLQVLEGPVSREHAIIRFDDGKVYLEDRSTNGTYIRLEGDEQDQFLHKDEVRLRGRGKISLGHPIDQNPEHLIRFEVD